MRRLLPLLFLYADLVPTAQALAQPVDAAEIFRGEDLESGTGAEARKGKTLTVHYTGWFYDQPKDERGRKFDSSHGGTPLSFRLGDGLVIKGWDDGLVGMRVGGVRTLIVPPAQAYGRKGKGPVPPDSWLMFEIELLDVK